MSDTFRGKTKEEYELEIQMYESSHTDWRAKMKSEKQGFFPVFSEAIKPHLKDLSGSALRLFIYLGVHSDNETGEVRARITNRTMTDFFNCSERTLHKWIAELENAGLIVRLQTRFKATGKIFMLPYTQLKDPPKKQQASM